jgi:ATP-dependent helicase STH1/SNF2
MTEQLKCKQGTEHERRAKQKHLKQLNSICVHRKEMVAANCVHQHWVLKLGRTMQMYHANTEKEGAKHIEGISKERLKVLKADNEEAYMKLIDTMKDTHITHLLRQTDLYLDSLAQAVLAQQDDDVHKNTHYIEEDTLNETAFGVHS